MSRFTILDAPLTGLKIIERQQVGDDRGFLSRLFCSQELANAGWCKPISQVNHTLTRKLGTLRGMHFQRPPHAEMKFVSCLRGRIWDVAVDLRAESPSFLQWHAEELSAENRRGLLIPEGFAHGFQTLTEDCELIYLHSMPYVANAEGGLNAEDPQLAISWPRPICEISDRDSNHPMVNADFSGITL